MAWEKIWNQAVSRASHAAQGPIGEKFKGQIEKGVMAAVKASQNLPSQEKISQLIEGKSPQIAQWILGRASEMNNPHQFGMGLKIVELGDEISQVILPHRWCNRSSSGAFHSGAISTLAEYTSRIFWQRHFGDDMADLRLQEVTGKFHQHSFRTVTAQFTMPGEERERILFDLRKNGEVEIESVVIIYGKNELKVAEYNLSWLATNQYAVSGNVSGQ